MLCQACEAHFTFSHPNHIKELIEIKRRAISSAAREGLGESLRVKLRDELWRYETGVDLVARASEPLCPWNTEDGTDYNLRYSGIGLRYSASIGVWGNTRPDIHVLPPRSFRELRESARSSGCRMCEILIAVAAYAVPEMDESAVVTSDIWLDQATCRPTRLQFNLQRYERGEKSPLLTMNISATNSGDSPREPNGMCSPFTLKTLHEFD